MTDLPFARSVDKARADIQVALAEYVIANGFTPGDEQWECANGYATLMFHTLLTESK